MFLPWTARPLRKVPLRPQPLPVAGEIGHGLRGCGADEWLAVLAQ